jgi:hypothetical protein
MDFCVLIAYIGYIYVRVAYFKRLIYSFNSSKGSKSGSGSASTSSTPRVSTFRDKWSNILKL